MQTERPLINNPGQLVRSFGVDTVGLTVPAHGGFGHGRWRLPAGGVVSLAWGIARIEASIPKRIYGHNISLVMTDELLAEVPKILADVAEVAPLWLDEPGELRVSRLDIARDFKGVLDPERFLDLLARRSLRKDWTTRLIGTQGRLDTLKLGPEKAWSYTLYDKHHETNNNDAAFCVLRGEARLRAKTLGESQWAHDVGGVVRCLADLDDEKIHALGRGTFVRVRADEPVTDDRGISYRLDWDQGTMFWP